MLVPADAVLIVDGFHVPGILLVDVNTNTPGVVPTQYGPKAANVGVTRVLLVTLPLI